MKLIALLAAIALLLVACGGTSSTTTAATATTAATTTTAGPTTTTTVATTTTATAATTTTTAAATTTTTAAPTTTTTVPVYTVANYGFFPDPFPGSDDANGSGCAPGATQLPDGIWFGYVEAETSTTLTFDLACFWTGDAAAAKATEDGQEVFDFYIRNTNPTTRTLTRDNTGTAYWLDASGDLTPQAIPMADWPDTGGTRYVPCPGDYCAVWVYVNGGEVTELVEQYLP